MLARICFLETRCPYIFLICTNCTKAPSDCIAIILIIIVGIIIINSDSTYYQVDFPCICEVCVCVVLIRQSYVVICGVTCRLMMVLMVDYGTRHHTDSISLTSFALHSS